VNPIVLGKALEEMHTLMDQPIPALSLLVLERSVSQSAVLDSLHDAIHDHPDLNALQIGHLAESVNANLRQRGEPRNLMERRVGDLLRSLLLTDRTRINIGWVLRLTRETREQIHSLARAYGVNGGTTADMTARCELCQSLSGRPTAASSKNPIEKSALRRTNHVNIVNVGKAEARGSQPTPFGWQVRNSPRRLVSASGTHRATLRKCQPGQREFNFLVVHSVEI
jgi:hypothetical protein